MSATEQKTGFFDHWAPIGDYLETGEGLEDVVARIGRLSVLSASGLGEINNVRGLLARARDKVDYDGHTGPNAEMIKTLLTAHIEALGEQELLGDMADRLRDLRLDESLANEELAFAAQELGVETKDLPAWMVVENRLRYSGPMPQGLYDYVARERAAFEAGENAADQADQ